MKSLEDLISEFESKISDHDLLNPEISKGSVGWHIEHALLTLNKVIEAMKQSDPADYKYTFDYKRAFVLLTGIIPRGKVRAPATVQPANNFDLLSLRQHISISKNSIQGLDILSKKHFFKHPFLGDIKLKPAIRFLRVHTNHHLKIINDIIKSMKGV